MKARNAAVNEANVLKQKELLITHYMEDFGKVINQPGKYAGRPGSAALYGDATLEYDGLMDPVKVKEVLDLAVKNAEVSVASSLEGLLGSLIA